MARLRQLSGRDLVKIVAKLGYRAVRQKGSHIRLVCPGRKSITIPDHRNIGKGLLVKILRDAKISISEFLKLLK